MRTITVSPKSDKLKEPSETLNITHSSPVHAGLADPQIVNYA